MQKRRLAAIMFTDIVGYTALMGSDEDLAFEVLRKNREIHTKLISEFNGTLIKEMGDGMLVSFNLASDAAQCAIEIQKRASEELKGQIRIGIHLGDITFEHEDVFGDGVNIASRLQSITDPGGIYLSESLQKSIRGKSEIKTKYLGEFNLKNVDYPVRTYAIQGVNLPIPTSAKIKSLKGKSVKERIFRSVSLYIVLLLLLISIGWWIRNEPLSNKYDILSLMVLPLNNYTGFDTLEYFVAGMHNAMILDIGKIGALRVKSTTTARAYKDTKKTIPEIASELNVDAMLEGSVTCLGDSICLRLKLVSAQEEEQLWIKDYKVEKSQILNLYNWISKEISEEINIQLTPQEESILAESRTVDPEAYDAYLKSHQFWGDFSPEQLTKARDYLNSAIEKDPDWAPLYMGMANYWMMCAQWGIYEPSTTDSLVNENLNKALELDPDLPDAHYLNGWIALVSKWDWAKAEKEFLKALAINPNDAMARIYYAHLLCILHRSDEAIPQAQLALELDPLNPMVQIMFSTAQIFINGCDADLIQIEELLADDPNNYGANVVLNYNSSYCGDYETAMMTEKLMLQTLLGGQFDEDAWKEIERIFEEKGYNAAYEKIAPIWEDQVNRQLTTPMDLSIVYTKANQYNKAMEEIVKGYEIRDHTMPWISTKSYFYEPFHDNPRFVAILEKMNLPLP